jgi:hypothetical protein
MPPTAEKIDAVIHSAEVCPFCDRQKARGRLCCPRCFGRLPAPVLLGLHSGDRNGVVCAVMAAMWCLNVPTFNAEAVPA